jgi:homoserine dehydrogenase
MRIALDNMGIDAAAIGIDSCAIRTTGPVLDADPVDVDERWLTNCPPVTVMPGFVGRDRSGSLSLLGRGGADLTALYLAHWMNAECMLVKDVDGLFTQDPVQRPFEAIRYTVATWRDLANKGRNLVQPKAVRFAEDREYGFVIAKPSGVGTRIGSGPSVLDATRTTGASSAL